MNEPTTSASKTSSNRLWVHISAFLSRKSPTTRLSYRGIIGEWSEFLGGPAGSPEVATAWVSATPLHAQAFLAKLEKMPGIAPRTKTSDNNTSTALAIAKNGASRRVQKKRGLDSTQSNSTIAKKCSVLRRIYRALINAGFKIEVNPFNPDDVPPPKKSGLKRPTEMIPFEKVIEIINLCDESTPKGLRDKALLAILFGGAVRRSEAQALRLADVRKSIAGTTYLNLRSTKSGKDAQQALPSWAAKDLNKFLAARKAEKASSGDFLFTAYSGQGGKLPTNNPMSESSIYKIFRSYCKRAGIELSVSPHSARATAITKLLSQGVSYREVQEFSRHSSVQMVEAYDKRRYGVDQNPAALLDYENKKINVKKSS